jgi:hypothetical protein
VPGPSPWTQSRSNRVLALIGEQVAAFIRPVEGKCVTPDELFAFCRHHLATQDPTPRESHSGVGNDSMLASSDVQGELTNRRQRESTEVRQEQWG